MCTWIQIGFGKASHLIGGRQQICKGNFIFDAGDISLTRVSIFYIENLAAKSSPASVRELN